MVKRYGHILIAMDGSEEAEKAFERGIELALEMGAEVALATVIDTRSFPTISPDGGAFEYQLSAEAEQSVKNHVELAKEKGVESVGSFVEKGNPKKLLAEEIPTVYGADLIVCGATGLNRIEKVLLGSISSYVVQHAVCDVLVAR
ncbi:universal stress protein [Listeria costaricensis]|uniref:universal stress protein n=1 Tax=Listeria costaricensis TaxID=2026604 RepID=UPI000C083D52|nr:universal stress protein [Listeria costaricensis]